MDTMFSVTPQLPGTVVVKTWPTYIQIIEYGCVTEKRTDKIMRTQPTKRKRKRRRNRTK